MKLKICGTYITLYLKLLLELMVNTTTWGYKIVPEDEAAVTQVWDLTLHALLLCWFPFILCTHVTENSLFLLFVCMLLDIFSQQECLHECNPWCSLLMKLRMAWNLMNPLIFLFLILFLVKVFSLLRSTPQPFQFSGKYLTTAKPHTERLVRQVWLKLPCNVCSSV